MGNNDVPELYDSTDRKSYDSQADCISAWEDMQWASHNEHESFSRTALQSNVRNTIEPTRISELYSSENFRAYQFKNGAGVVMHYSTREAIRLVDGTVISNSQCWSEGFAHCTSPSDKDAVLPLQAIEAHLDDDDSVWNITDIVGQPETRTNDYTGNTYESHKVENTAVKIDGADNPYWVLLGRDPSIKEGNSRFTMRVSDSPFARNLVGPNGVSEYIERNLKPIEVAESGYEVVSSDEYTKTRLTENERTRHKQAGGNLGEPQSRWRDEPVNYQHYRANLQGKRIVRQGEWFFIPRPNENPRNTGTHAGSEILDNHTAVRHDSPRVPLPTACPYCESQSFDLGDSETREVICNECGNKWEQPIYVRGEVKHENGDHDSINLGETWHEAVTHDRAVRVYDPEPTKGSHARRGRARWD